MPNLAARLAGTGTVKIVAFGSSSTAGERGIIPYPYRLEQALRSRYQNRALDVLNRGVGGEEAPQELKRIRQDVLSEQPSVVIWHVGTNAVWQQQDLADMSRAIADGLTLFEDLDADIVLMDSQYTPAVLVENKIEAAERMEKLISEAAAIARRPVNLFRRFDLMRRWHEVERISFDRMVDPDDPDRLHHSDWSMTRTAGALADEIVKAAGRAIAH
jgi:GDSL-like Lipase/Acylhydrolase family